MINIDDFFYLLMKMKFNVFDMIFLIHQLLKWLHKHLFFGGLKGRIPIISLGGRTSFALHDFLRIYLNNI